MLPEILIVMAMLPADPAEVAPAKLPAGASATLPLEELLEMHDELQATAQSKPSAPPVPAALTKMELNGRLLDQAVSLTAHIEADVLAPYWVALPLLQVDDDTSVVTLPTLEGASVVVRDGHLQLLANRAGHLVFEVTLLKRAAGAGAGRRIELLVHQPEVAVLHLGFDSDLFRLVDTPALPEGDGVLLYPRRDRFVVGWQRTVPRHNEPVVKRPPVEPVITAAHASVVSTLEGKRITRLSYELRFEGTQKVRLTIPDGQQIERVFLNGAPLEVALRGRELNVEVRPARAGDAFARLELVLGEPPSAYTLSGQLAFVFPAASWRINDMDVVLSLPDVFDYKWAGGSLAAVEGAPAVEYTYRIPEPGERVTLHQQLVFAPPTAKIDYTVDLAHKYFTAQAE